MSELANPESNSKEFEFHTIGRGGGGGKHVILLRLPNAHESKM